MGFNCVGIGSENLRNIRELEPLVINNLREASKMLKQGKCREQSFIWFGDKRDNWINDLSKKLNSLATFLNLTEIRLSCVRYTRRNTDFYGWAIPPSGGWRNYSSTTLAHQTTFEMQLDHQFLFLPKRNLGNYPEREFTQYHAIIHELTHLALATDDHDPAYGIGNCQRKAKNNVHQAKTNADNFAFFMDYYKVPVELIPTKEWKSSTSRWYYKRSSNLKGIDTALSNFNSSTRLQYLANLRLLNRAIEDWKNSKGTNEEWKKSTRNKSSQVEDLIKKVNLLRRVAVV